MIIFWIVFGIDAIAELIALYFFVIGLGDGSVSSFNIVIWLALLGGIAAIIGGAWALNAKGRRGAAIALLSILGAPSFGFGAFMLLLILTQPNWH